MKLLKLSLIALAALGSMAFSACSKPDFQASNIEYDEAVTAYNNAKENATDFQTLDRARQNLEKAKSDFIQSAPPGRYTNISSLNFLLQNLLSLNNLTNCRIQKIEP